MKLLINFIFLTFFSICNLSAQIDTIIICNQGDPVQLIGPLNQFAYQWIVKNGISNPTIANPIARPRVHTTYIVRSISNLLSENLIENPDFNKGPQGFTSDYQFAHSIRTQGLYGVNVSAANLNPFSFEDCADHTGGNGQMLIVDGFPEPNKKVWCQTVDIFPEANYVFSAWLSSVNPRNPAALQFSINGQLIGNTFFATKEVCEWRQFFEVWESGASTTAEICIINRNTNRGGNDFALDDFAFHEIEGLRFDTTQVMIESIILAEDRNVFIPNTFTPNGDGVNDLFQPFMGKGALSILEFKIYDRWGGTVFEQTKCPIGSDKCAWDGTANGRIVPFDSYTYFAKINYADGFNEVRTGKVQLIR